MMSELLVTIGSSPVFSLVVKATMLLGTGLLISALAWRARAAVRHLVMASMFAALFALPVARMVAPIIELPVVVDARSIAPANPTMGVALGSVARKVPLGEVLAQAWTIPRLLHAVRNWSSIDFTIESIATMAWVVWTAGALMLLAPLVAGAWRFGRLRRRALPCVALQHLTGRLAAEARIRRPVDVVCHERVSSPLTCGFRRPAIVLPLDVGTWPSEDVRRALVHELEHVRRGDWIVQIAARAVCALYWFHPLAWAAWRQLCLEAERACDDAVVRTAERADYADQLVLLARRSGASAPLALGMARRSDLAARVTALLDDRRRRGRAGLRSIATSGVSTAILVATLAPVQT
ncbi:MAG: M56 family metallopeptidase, partial [Vicinamibacterales bacterium]